MSDNRSDKDRRSVTTRRNFFYTAHVPERRSGDDRRSESNRRSGTERRTYHRFLAKNPTFVTLWTEHEKDFAERDGQLLDISRGGIAIRCTAKPKEPNDYSLLEVFLSDDSNIEDIRFKIVSSIELISDSVSSELTLRRYGLQFEELNPDQINRLNNFLTNHTIGEA